MANSDDDGKVMEKRPSLSLIVMPAGRKESTHSDPANAVASDRLVTRACRSLFMSIVYVVFVYSILLQSAWTRKGIDPSEWKDTLTLWAWKSGLFVFCALVAACLSLLAFTPHSFTSDVIVYSVMSALFVLHLLTIAYASYRPELCRVKKKARRVASCFGVPISVRFTYWRNYLVFVSIALEFVQYMSIALRFSDYASQPVVTSIQVSLLAIASDHITFYVVIVLVALYSLFVGVFVEVNVQPSDPLAPVLYDFCAGTLYLPLVSRLITVMRKSSSSTITAVSLLALVFYSSTAVFVGVYRGDQGAQKSDINYVPRHCVVERVIMAILSLCVAFFSDMKSTLRLCFMCLLAVFACILGLTQCCSLDVVARVRVATVSVAVWCMATNIAIANGSDVRFHVMFFPGLGVIFATFVVYSLIRRSSDSQRNSNEKPAFNDTPMIDNPLRSPSRRPLKTIPRNPALLVNINPLLNVSVKT